METRDDFGLARLEIQGLTGTTPSDPNDFDSRDTELLDLAHRLGIPEDHLISAPLNGASHEMLSRRLGMSSHVLTTDSAGEAQVFETEQTEYEYGAGATGIAALTAGTARAKNSYLTHGFHKYKAKFFPRMARSLTNLVSPTGNVGDPFAGSGTLSVEASLMGIESFGVDIDPLSTFIARGKVGSLHVPLELFESARAHLSNRLGYPDPGDEEPSERDKVPEFIGRKMESGTRASVENEVRVLRAAIETFPDAEGRDFLMLALSHAIATKVSLRWMGTGDPRFSLSVAKRSITQIMTAHLGKMIAGIRERDRLEAAGMLSRSRLGAAEIQVGDARNLPWAAGSIDGIVTSPPYIPASSGRETYLRSRAWSLSALGLMTESEVVRRELDMVGTISRGAPVDSKGLPESISELVSWMLPQRARSPKALPTAAYFLDIAASLREMGRVLKGGGKVAMVLSFQHVFYDSGTRENVRVLNMPDTIGQLISDPQNEIPLTIDSVLKLILPKMDYAARPASTGEYAEAVIVASRAT